jgi:hypothetical protein
MGLLRHVVAGAGGGAAFLVFYLGLQVSAGLSLLLGGAAYGGLLLLGRALTPAAAAVSGNAAGDLIAGAVARLRRLELLAEEVPPAVRPALARIVAASLETLALVEDQPDDAMAHRRPLTFWLDITLRIAEQAARLQALSGDIHPDLARITGMLDEVEKAFAEHADSALAGVEVQLAVLARSIDAERARQRPGRGE